MTQYRIELYFDGDLLEVILRLLSEFNVQAESRALSELGGSALGSSKDHGLHNSNSAIRNPKRRPEPVEGSEIHSLLADFGVEEPVLSELSSDGLTPDLVRAWILYIQTQDLERPAGYLVNRLRAGQAPADVWMTLGRLSEEQRACLHELAGHRKWIGDWNRDELATLGLDEEAAEAWYQANRKTIGVV